MGTIEHGTKRYQHGTSTVPFVFEMMRSQTRRFDPRVLNRWTASHRAVSDEHEAIQARLLKQRFSEGWRSRRKPTPVHGTELSNGLILVRKAPVRAFRDGVAFVEECSILIAACDNALLLVGAEEDAEESAVPPLAQSAGDLLGELASSVVVRVIQRAKLIVEEVHESETTIAGSLLSRLCPPKKPPDDSMLLKRYWCPHVGKHRRVGIQCWPHGLPVPRSPRHWPATVLRFCITPHLKRRILTAEL